MWVSLPPVAPSVPPDGTLVGNLPIRLGVTTPLCEAPSQSYHPAGGVVPLNMTIEPMGKSAIIVSS